MCDVQFKDGHWLGVTGETVEQVFSSLGRGYCNGVITERVETVKSIWHRGFCIWKDGISCGGN